VLNFLKNCSDKASLLDATDNLLQSPLHHSAKQKNIKLNEILC